MALTPKNWTSFQHYKDRAPVWIKLHRALLDDFAFARLPVASKALAPLLWLLASEYEDGKITATNEEIAFRLRMTGDELSDGLNPLIEAGFFAADSKPLARRKRDACLEEEREKETQGEKEKDIRAVAKATRPSDSPFEEFWKVYPKRDGANPKAPAQKVFTAAVKSGHDPAHIVGGAKRYADELRAKGQIGTAYVAQALTWLRQARWEDYAREPESNAAIPMAGFYAADGSPQLDAWDSWSRATKGSNMPRDRNFGWRVDSEWPPGHERAAA